MNKFLFKSTDADLSKILSILETLQKNTLYITYRVDSMLKKVNELVTDKHLQRQVDDYFDPDDKIEQDPDQDKEPD